MATHWTNWLQDLQKLEEINIPRWLGTKTLNADDRKIHIFCDASERAYGAALYIFCTASTTPVISLMCSKSRLATIKRVSLLSLELLAALVGARLLHYFCEETKHTTQQAILWIDAKVTLSRIQGDPSRWKSFVANRVAEIHSLSDPVQWRYCPGKDNPADLLACGISVTLLKQSEVWWNGPQWLAADPSTWPIKDPTPVPATVAVNKMRLRPQVLTIPVSLPADELFDTNRFSKYWRLLRATAWAFRFITKCQKRACPTGDLNAAEILVARCYWIGAIQRKHFYAEVRALQLSQPLPDTSSLQRYHPFLDKGLIRLGGRLQFAPIDPNERQTIILHVDHNFTKLLIADTHTRLYHLRTRIVWIVKGCQTIRTVISQCLTCRKQRSKPGQQIVAPLPLHRVQPTIPFDVCGLDFAGPLLVRQCTNRVKSYIVLFTCATTRALHLELASDTSTATFLLALQLFIGRRGVPAVIYSDNATSFHVAHCELQEVWPSITSHAVTAFLAHQGITWNFIVAHAAWWGGWWERMIGSVKRCLRKSLGSALMTSEELQTVLVGIEAALNSRPIVHDYGSEDNEAPLTPPHFLHGERLTKLPSASTNSPTKELTRAWRSTQKLLDIFWKRWQKEYLLDLRNYHQVKQQKGGPLIRYGNLVTIKDDKQPLHIWKIGRITEIRKGRDGKERTCILRMPNRSQIARPVQLLFPLEIGGENVESPSGSVFVSL